MVLTIPERLQKIPAAVRKVTAAEAKAECEQNGGVVIDVRESAEREENPVSGSVHIPRGVLEMKACEQFRDPQTPIYIHCASGVRAQLAAEQLHNMGYDRVSAITCDLTKVKDVLHD
ncbi:rhodanese-like domain-containing protein [Alteromonas sp. CYL-A6]|uniref:rhodanese-like domain-containing protein n=1 Tax=Alteromonas nitratireducens TaxID=3390813 RepID=UPI0034A99DF7